ncbi:exported hypothetical protein [Mesorhizobium ventifaucium]|uniref:Twin-arginine translocation signal domain-containing protein n=1 Tax=Mesorhizobium ventifaucium TaxID=666020 RepID=A0ABN8JZF2_9HYPH|nr:exported hypothetical protein [Mesorhizobium ventifaucium]
MTLSRRHFLASAGLAGGALLAGTSVPALARAPLAHAPTLGALRRKVGSIEVTALLDGYIDIGSEWSSGSLRPMRSGWLRPASRSPDRAAHRSMPISSIWATVWCSSTPVRRTAWARHSADFRPLSRRPASLRTRSTHC